MENLVEAPKIINPEKVTPDTAKRVYQDFKNDKRSVVLSSPYSNADLIQNGDRFAILDHDRKEITYYMEFKERDLDGHKAVFQSMVWRDATVAGTEGVVSTVFFDKLLPMHGIITTDNIQTDLGKSFWRSAIGKAIQKKLYVYYMDLNTKSIPSCIKSQSDLDSVVDFIWGKGEENRYRLVMISQKEFKSTVGMDIDDFGVPN